MVEATPGELVIVTDGTPRYRAALERHVEAAGVEGVRFVNPFLAAP